jgi:hypothetical protein
MILPARIVSARSPPTVVQVRAGHFKRDAQEALGLGVEFMAVKE